MNARLLSTLSGAAAAAALVLTSAAAADAPAVASPPADGAYAVAADTTTTTPGHPLLNITGSFKVSGGAVSDFQGTTTGTLNRGCIKGVHIALVGTVPILHFHLNGDEGPVDYYYAGGNGKIRPYAPVTLIFTGHGRHAKPTRGHGELRIYFPGAIGVNSAAEDWGQVTYSSPVGGICNLQFTPKG